MVANDDDGRGDGVDGRTKNKHGTTKLPACIPDQSVSGSCTGTRERLCVYLTVKFARVEG